MKKYECKICEKEYDCAPSTYKLGKRTCSRECSYILRGNKKANDLTGKKFRHLTAIERITNRRGKIFWKAKCDCGNYTEVDANALTRKDGKGAVSCGCKNFRTNQDSANWKSPNEIPWSYFFRAKCSSERRKINFSISIEYAHQIFLAQEGKCALTGQPLNFKSPRSSITASLDRIDSAKGYIEGNIQWLHKDINRLKSDWNENEFLKLCKRVTDYDKTTQKSI